MDVSYCQVWKLVSAFPSIGLRSSEMNSFSNWAPGYKKEINSSICSHLIYSSTPSRAASCVLTNRTFASKAVHFLLVPKHPAQKPSTVSNPGSVSNDAGDRNNTYSNSIRRPNAFLANICLRCLHRVSCSHPKTWTEAGASSSFWHVWSKHRRVV